MVIGSYLYAKYLPGTPSILLRRVRLDNTGFWIVLGETSECIHVILVVNCADEKVSAQMKALKDDNLRLNVSLFLLITGIYSSYLVLFASVSLHHFLLCVYRSLTLRSHRQYSLTGLNLDVWHLFCIFHSSFVPCVYQNKVRNHWFLSAGHFGVCKFQDWGRSIVSTLR